MKCLVTGVAGFVGSSIADALLLKGMQVRGIDCFTDYYDRSIKERNISSARLNSSFEFIEGDLLKTDLQSLLEGCTWVFHQAAQAGVRASWGETFKSYTDNNILATQRLLEAIKGLSQIKKVVFASSSSVYGNAEVYPTTEVMRPLPVSPYGVTKLASENLMVLYSTEYGVPTVSLRYFTVYGPRQRPDMSFNRFIKGALRGEELVVYGDGQQSRDFTFISDIVAANLQAAELGKSGAVYNIGGGTQATINQVLDIIISEVGKLKVRYSDRAIGDARHTGADTSRARNELGFRSTVSLEEGLKREIEWLRSEINQ